MIDWNTTAAAIYRRKFGALKGVIDVDFTQLEGLIGIEKQKEELVKNTRNFLEGKGANHAILWGARGCGKSSLVKAVFTKFYPEGLRLIELKNDELEMIPEIIYEIRDSSYKFLKPVLEGSIEKAPKNVLVYATSNRRHLISELKSDNEGARVGETELHYSDAVEEKIALSDRFGLWLSFYQGSFADYLKIVDFYFKDFVGDRAILHELAKQYAQLRASRSGRTARQFYLSYKDKI